MALSFSRFGKTCLLFIASVLAGLMLLIGGGLALRIRDAHRLFQPGNEEALDICLNTPGMDCDPTGWQDAVVPAAVCIVFGLAMLGLTIRWMLAETRRGSAPAERAPGEPPEAAARRFLRGGPRGG